MPNAEEILELLRSLEWADSSCPMCLRIHHEGHGQACELRGMIEQIEQEGIT